MSAALYSSAGSLREYWEHSFQARDGLTGSILKLKDGSWAIIPPDDRSVKQISGAWKALCKPSSGAAGKNILVKDIGNTVSHILPAVLSTHLERVRNPVTPAMAHGSKDAEGRLLGPSAAT